MITYVPYRTTMYDIIGFLKSHLYVYAEHVNLQECARAVVHDYFGCVFHSPYPCTTINGCNIYLNNESRTIINNGDYAFIGSVINSSFWCANKTFSYLLSHCGNSTFQSVPTECYFTIDRNNDMIVYVPVHNALPKEYSQLAVPQSALLGATKGGTVSG